MKLFVTIFIVGVFLSGCMNVEKNRQLTLKDNLLKTNELGVLKEMNIYDAARINDIELLNFLLLQNKLDINKKDRYGYTPLHLAARFNHLEIAKILIENGALVNSVDKFGDTALLDSTRNAYTQMSKLLLCNKAKSDIKDKYGFKAFDYALKTNDQLIIKMLESKNINSFCENKDKTNDVDENINNIDTASLVENLQVQKNLIKINEYYIINDSTPKICGKILKNSIDEVKLYLNGMEFESKIENNTWCVSIDKYLKNGDYNIKVVAKNKNFIDEKNSTFSIHILNSLYEALYEEFEDDLKNWNAQLDKQTLTFRFLNPQAMFSYGSLELNEKYKTILESFIPRYIETLYKYKDQIVNVLIQGHTSSEYSSAKSEEEKFEKNMQLSQKRAQNVYSFIKSIEDKRVKDNIIWIEKNFFPEGKSSLETIKNKDGLENLELSRRVEFKIQTVPK
ncbi:ankyrin repeat protein [Malaciobacter marinus]|jgi:outer membrane protein OmpA-like peptidoglycan-associated protein|uniref:Ankyrin repeat protein n=1 Tax=Malaciobacter marinus TaxID=505249 RepID=A0AB36ZTW6_9BACT|nr:ankyrin repeat domain-containing protein [Malaciobacter marinus]PPK60581.1 ankyrin repeat protein [Malaciobacter marinus]